MTIRVLLADDQALLRQTFRILITATPDMEVVGEAADGNQAAELTRAHHPDVIVMDIRMPGTDGLAATEAICADPELSGTRILIRPRPACRHRLPDRPRPASTPAMTQRRRHKTEDEVSGVDRVGDIEEVPE